MSIEILLVAYFVIGVATFIVVVPAFYGGFDEATSSQIVVSWVFSVFFWPFLFVLRIIAKLFN